MAGGVAFLSMPVIEGIVEETGPSVSVAVDILAVTLERP